MVKQAVITLTADRVEFGELVQRSSREMAHQTARLYQGDQCVTVVTLMWPAGVPAQGTLTVQDTAIDGRHGAQD